MLQCEIVSSVSGMKKIDRSFHIRSLDQLRSEIRNLGLNIPVSEDVSVLSEPLVIGDITVPNRICIQPMEGCDSFSDGAPGPMTFRRYTRYAAGGAGLIWVEATAVVAEGRSNPSQLHINRNNIQSFAELVKAVRKTAVDTFGRDIIVLLQITHSGRFSNSTGVPSPVLVHRNPDLDTDQAIAVNHPVVQDDYLDGLMNSYIEAAVMADQAGFDGVDVKSCHRDLVSELLASFTRPGRFGGSFENRSRFLLETVTAIKEKVSGLILATRMSGYDAVGYPYGFGVDRDDMLKPDLDEPIRLARRLKDIGVSILNISTGSPLIGSDIGRSPNLPINTADHGEHPLMSLNRVMEITNTIQNAVPGLPVVGGWYSWSRQFLPFIAAGSIVKGGSAFAGLGRIAMAYPDAARDIFEKGEMEPVRCCITCESCIQLLRDGGVTGCVIKDSGIYGPEYRNKRHFAMDNLRQEASRCHNCESAACTEACPTRIDIPGFIKAFEKDNIEKAFRIIRQSNVLPEMCSHLCPAWIMCEEACIESTLCGNSIPIKDIQYVVCWLARERGLTAVNVSAEETARRVAIVGGGPAGSACAISLLEKGHNVTIFERDQYMGGAPESVIRSSRLTGVRTEIDTVLQPAVKAGRLEMRYGCEFGRDITLSDLREQYDAVLLAGGVFKEASIGNADGVVDALSFLRKAKNGEISSVPSRVALLSGGDCAMDAAVTAKELGAVDLYLVYSGSLSDMHWHLNDSWFRSSGSHCVTLTEPLGYETDQQGRLTGLKIRRTEQGQPDEYGRRAAIPVPGSEGVLKVEMVIEAMGLSVADDFRKAVAGIDFDDNGLVRLPVDDSFQTGLNRVYAAGGMINGGASVCQCIAEGMKAAEEIDGRLHQ